MPKTALVISGGGSKGAFAVGAIKALAANPSTSTFDIYIGTSTGALIVPFAAMGGLDQLEKIYTTITTDQVITKQNLGDAIASGAIFITDPLLSLIGKNYTDDFCNKLFASPKEVYIVTTCLQTGETVYFSNHDKPAATNGNIIKAIDPDIFRFAVYASASQPVLMPPVEVENGKAPLRHYVDGGVRVYAGIQLAIDAGATEIYAILLSPAVDSPEEKDFSSAGIVDTLKRTIDIFTKDTAINNLRQPLLYALGLWYIADVKAAMLKGGVSQAEIDRFFNIDPANPFSNKNPVTIYVIRPDASLDGGDGGLDFIPANMMAMLNNGEHITSDFLANLPPRGSNMV